MQKRRNKKQLAKKVVTGSAKVPLKSAVFLVTKTGKFVFKLPAQVAYRGTRGAYRKMKSRRRVGPGMIFSEAGDQQVIEGPLHKWVNYVRGWQKRWFLLEAPGLLAYYSNHKKKTCLGTIPLSDAVVTISRRSPLRFVVDTDYGIFYLRATSADQRNQWIQGIKHSQQQAEQPDISEGDEGMTGGDDDMSDSGDEEYEPYGYGNPNPALMSELDQRLALVTTRLTDLEAEKEKFSLLVSLQAAAEGAGGGDGNDSQGQLGLGEAATQLQSVMTLLESTVQELQLARGTLRAQNRFRVRNGSYVGSYDDDDDYDVTTPRHRSFAIVMCDLSARPYTGVDRSYLMGCLCRQDDDDDDDDDDDEGAVGRWAGAHAAAAQSDSGPNRNAEEQEEGVESRDGSDSDDYWDVAEK